MAWFKVDDKFFSSRKVLAIPRSKRPQAIGYWTLIGVWAASELTNGFVPDYYLEEVCIPEDIIEQLLIVGLWDSVEGGIQFHNWDKYQPTKEKVLDDRQRALERQQKWREKQGNAVAEPLETKNNNVSNGVTSALVTEPRPDPTRPDPTRPDQDSSNELSSSSAKQASRESRGTRLSEDSVLTDQWRAFAEERGVDADYEFDQFYNYWTAKAGRDATKLDWFKTWQNRVNAVSRTNSRKTMGRAEQQRAALKAMIESEEN